MPIFRPRDRKHKHRKNDKSQNVYDSNAVQIIAPSQQEREEKRRTLKDELRNSLPRISSKKQKRLDKYIDNKVRKEENLALLKKLSQSTFDTSKLQSSKNLGKRKHAEFVADMKQHEEHSNVYAYDDSDSEAVSDEGLGTKTQNRTTPKESQSPTSLPSMQPQESPAPVSALGSGLRHPLQVGADGLPDLKVRNRASKPQIVPAELPWEGFDSISGSDSDGKSSDSASMNDYTSLTNGDTETSDSSEDGDETESEDSVSVEGLSRPKIRQSAFKSWAAQQINNSIGFTPSNAVTEHLVKNLEPKHATSAPKVEELKSPELSKLSHVTSRKAFAVTVHRSAEIQEARLELPIVAEEQKIMEAVHNNTSVIVCGATGSGKTTQIPQFLLEAGYGAKDAATSGLIGVTQPRRVAAVSMAARVGHELAEHGEKVSYQIRFESTTSPKTAIKFMTDGVLLREIAQDFALNKYSVIVVDEAHERSVNTDILIGMLSRITDLRKKMSIENESMKPLQLIIMSATLRTSDFLQNANLFRTNAPPLVHVEGRQYPVTVHFARRTERDYIEEAFQKVIRGHRRLPPGGMLVFLTGQNEIKAVLKRLSSILRSSASATLDGPKVRISANEAPLEAEDLELGGLSESDLGDDDDINFLGLEEDEEDDDFDIEDTEVAPSTSVRILPLYSQLPTKEQLRVFEPSRDGSRMIVLATNVAETSLTIPGIKYVFDCGRSKERVYDPITGVQKFSIDWISKASAEQRAGRAGRTGPGHCYRLYSSAVYERDFAEFTEPEILRTPLESVVLQLKTMGIDHVLKFPFPTPPDRFNLAKAERLLKNLGALSQDDRVTPLGHSLSIYPLSPRFGKMMAIGSQHGCLPYVIAVVAGLAMGDVFIPESELDMAPVGHNEGEVYTNEDRLEDSARDQRRKAYNKAQALFTKLDRTSDALRMLSALCAYAYTPVGEDFCEEMFLRSKAMKEASQLRQQLSDIVKANHPTQPGAYPLRLPEPSSTQIKALRQIVAAGFLDQIAIRADLAPNPPEMIRKPRRAIDVPYLTLFPVQIGRASEIAEKAVFIHPSSILSRQSAKDLPQFLIYSHLQQAAASTIGEDKITKVRMFPLTSVTGAQISALASGTPLIEYGKPIGKIESLGGSPETRECWVIPSLVGESGSMGWPLPARKVVQVKDIKAGWVIEKFVT